MNPELKKAYQESMKKLEELTNEHGEEGKELHLEWLKKQKVKKNNQQFLEKLTDKEQQEFEGMFGSIETLDKNNIPL